MNKNTKYQTGNKRDKSYRKGRPVIERLAPYTEEENAEIWRLLDKRGDTRSKLVVALIEDVGLRMREICELRVADIDLDSRQVSVQSVKSAHGRTLPFGDRVQGYLLLWIREHRGGCGDDFLLHDSQGRPYTEHQIRHELARRLCRTLGGRKVNDDGLEHFSWYRLRLAALRR